MTGTLHHLGYASRDAQERLAQFMANEQAILVDTRFTPYANGRPEWCKDGLAGVWGKRYQVIHELGNKNYRGGPIELVNQEQGLLRLTQLLRTQNVMLLCGCQHYNKCHRSVIVELVKEQVPEAFLCMIEGCSLIATSFSPSGSSQYCLEHSMCARGHVVDWAQDDRDNRWVCRCVIENRRRVLDEVAAIHHQREQERQQLLRDEQRRRYGI